MVEPLDQGASVGARRWLKVPSPFSIEPGSMLLLEPEGGFDEEQRARVLRGEIEQPFIIDRERTRQLFFSLDAVQSAMALDDPDALITPYVRKMMAFLLFNPAPRRVLLLGLGGGSLAKFCYRHLPRTDITVVEIDAEVIALRTAFAIPPDDERFRVIHMDAARYLEAPGTAMDAILIDAFDREGIAMALEAPRFYQLLLERLTAKGILVMNLSGQKRRYPLHVRRICEAFGTAVRLIEVQREDNVLLLAAHGNVARLPSGIAARAATLETRFGLPFRHYLKRLKASSVVRVVT